MLPECCNKHCSKVNHKRLDVVCLGAEVVRLQLSDLQVAINYDHLVMSAGASKCTRAQ